MTERTVTEARAVLDRVVRSGTHIGAPEYRAACDGVVAAAMRDALALAARACAEVVTWAPLGEGVVVAREAERRVGALAAKVKP